MRPVHFFRASEASEPPQPLHRHMITRIRPFHLNCAFYNREDSVPRYAPCEGGAKLPSWIPIFLSATSCAYQQSDVTAWK